MKKKSKFQRWFGPVLCGVLAAGSVAVSQAQTFTNIVISEFDGSEAFSALYRWWGVNTFSCQWDGTVNSPTTLAPTNAGSGSIIMTSDWTGTSGASGNPEPQLMLMSEFSQQWYSSYTVNGFYCDLTFDLLLDPSSAKTANGDYGHIQAGVLVNGATTVQCWDSPAFNSNGWAHVHAYIDPTQTGVDSISGFYLYWPWQTVANNAGAIQGPQKFWIDNLIFVTNLTKPLAPPTLSLAPVQATPGLNISSSGSGQYDRNSLGTTFADYSWVGKGSTPAVYSLTIAKYPGTNFANYQAHIFLCSGASGAVPGTENAPDWNEPNCVFLQILNGADGAGNARLMYKINDPNANDQLWGSGTLGYLTDTNGVQGTWSLTFEQDTNVTITSPSGMKAAFTFTNAADIQNAFPPGSVVAYFGAVPDTTANAGQTVVLSQIALSGFTTPITDNFTEETLDPNVWTICAAQPADISLVKNNIAFTLSWTLPDLHYYLQVAPKLTGPWTDPHLTNNITVLGAVKSVLVPKTALPSPGAGFFRMVKPVATKLQVLLPGETAAPGTPTGKTGTPTAQPVNTAVNVIVNAVDSDWNVVPYVTDTVTITSTDATALLPADAALANGTGTFSITFATAGSWTVTATDVTDSAKAAGTSASVTVTP